MPRLWVLIEPRLYADLIIRLFQSMRGIEVIDIGSINRLEALRSKQADEQVDIVILSLNPSGEPDLRLLPEHFSASKIIAFSPAGDCGKLRFNGENDWRTVVPFTLVDIINEVFDQDSYPVHNLSSMV